MNTQNFSLLILFVFFLVGCSSSSNEQKSQPPNIIFLLTDDQRWDALGVMGNSIIQTPNLDQLANNGTLFTRAYVTTAICCTSRASILSGQYASRHQINDFNTPFSDAALQATYPLILKNQGYSIGFIGKYGVGNPSYFPKVLYDYWACEDKLQPNYENFDKQGNFIHHTDLTNQQISDFLDTFGVGEKPFCLSVSFKAPHCEDNDPRQFIYQERMKDKYAGLEIPESETADSLYYYAFPEGFRNPKSENKLLENEARKRWKLRFPNNEKYQETVRSYYRLISGVDEVVGNLMQQLKDLGIADNTIILFMGDNGFYLGEHGMAGKWYAHQESIRVPFIVYDPRTATKERGKKSDDIVLNIDVAPTILALVGIEVPNSMQGQNVFNFISGQAAARKSFYYEHKLKIPTIPNSEALVSKEFKYIRYLNLPEPFEELYDLEKDPYEKNNLANNPEYAALLQSYRDQLEEMSGAAQ